VRAANHREGRSLEYKYMISCHSAYTMGIYGRGSTLQWANTCLFWREEEEEALHMEGTNFTWALPNL